MKIDIKEEVKLLEKKLEALAEDINYLRKKGNDQETIQNMLHVLGLVEVAAMVMYKAKHVAATI